MNISIGNIISISNFLGDSNSYVNFSLTQFVQCSKFETQIYASIQEAKDVCSTNRECVGVEDIECRDVHGSAHGCNEILEENCLKKKGKLGCRFCTLSLLIKY